MSLEDLGRLVRQKRGEMGMTQGDVGIAIGKSHSWISRLETGALREYPDPQTVERLAVILGLSVRAVLEVIGYRIEDAPTAPSEDLERIDLGDPALQLWAGRGVLDDFAAGVIRLHMERKRQGEA